MLSFAFQVDVTHEHPNNDGHAIVAQSSRISELGVIDVISEPELFSCMYTCAVRML
jgi:hypothetical protein